VYLRSSNGKQLLSFVSVSMAAVFEYVLSCSLRLCYHCCAFHCVTVLQQLFLSIVDVDTSLLRLR